MPFEPKSRQSLRFQAGEESPYAQVEVSKVEKESDRIINSLRQVINQQTEALAAQGRLITQSQEDSLRLAALSQAVGELRSQLAEQGRRKAVLGLWVKAAVVLAAVSSVGAFASAVGLLRLYMHPPASLMAPGAARASSSGPWVFGGGASLWASLGAEPAQAPSTAPGADAARGAGALATERPVVPERPAPLPTPESASDPRRPAEVKDAVPHITVPNLVGMRFRDAQRAMSARSLSLESGEKKLRTSMKIGWQSVEPGLPIEPGAIVRVRKHAP